MIIHLSNEIKSKPIFDISEHNQEDKIIVGNKYESVKMNLADKYFFNENFNDQKNLDTDLISQILIDSKHMLEAEKAPVKLELEEIKK